jgi:hypothetical protein
MATFLRGRKTYITALAGAVYGVLIATKVVHSEAGVWAIIGSANVAAWRSALATLFGPEPTPVLPAPAVDVAALQAAVNNLQAAMPK